MLMLMLDAVPNFTNPPGTGHLTFILIGMFLFLYFVSSLRSEPKLVNQLSRTMAQKYAD